MISAWTLFKGKGWAFLIEFSLPNLTLLTSLPPRPRCAPSPTFNLPRHLFDAFKLFLYLDRKDQLFKSKMQ